MSSDVEQFKLEPPITINSVIVNSSKSTKKSTNLLKNQSKKSQKSTPKRQSSTLSHESTTATFKCSKCPQTFEFKSQQIIHEMSHRVKKSCQVCSKKIYRENMQEHMEFHLKNKTYFCDFCNKRFPTKYLTLVHLRSNHMNTKLFYCHCGRGFNDKRHYSNHQLTHIEDQPFKCDLCPKSYARKQTLEFHVIGAHQTERKLKCTLCDFQSCILMELKNHRLTHLKKYKCEICQKEFNEPRYLALHHETKHIRTRNYQCLICDKTFLTAKYVKRHIRLIHDDDLKKFRYLASAISPQSQPQRMSNQKVQKSTVTKDPVIPDHPKLDSPTICVTKRIGVTSQSVFRYLNKVKEQKKAQQQETREIKTESESVTENDQILMEKVKEEPMEEVVKHEAESVKFTITPYRPRMSFSTIRLLDANFPCPTCNQTFKNRSTLMLHEPKCQFKSDDANSFKCDFCAKKFSDQFTLEIHVNVKHVNVKLHKCGDCGFTTTKYFTFRSHKLTHMKLVQCLKCDKKFPTEKTMLEHVKGFHSGPSGLKCENCGLRFKSSVLLKRHTKEMHLVDG